jgi:large subunit ribosomal protein L14
MLQDRSLVKIADNSGGIIGRVFKVLGGSKRRYAGVGDEIVISIQTAQPRKSVKKKEVHRAVVVRTTNALRRKDGSYVRFDENAVVLITGSGKEPKEPKASRVFGPIPREVVERGYQRIGTLAPEIV